MSDALPLPPRPNLEQYKKLAKDLQAACKSGDPGAIRNWAARWHETIARLQGQEITSGLRGQIDRAAARMAQGWQKLAKTNERVARCTLTGAQFFVARGHGFASWPKFADHVEALERANSPVSKFEEAVDAVVSGDAERLGKLLRENPELARACSTREHRSTLLHYVSANGVEDFRQKTPKNIVEITDLLLDAGADVNAESEAYGGGSTTLGLVATSIHPQQAGVQIALLQKLLDRGARLDQPSAAGNAHSVVYGCLANGQPDAAEFLAGVGAQVDMAGAAGLGRMALLKSYFDENGAPRALVDRRQMEAAFEQACWYGRKEAAEFLLERGIDPGLRSARGMTGLHRAAYTPHLGIVKLLLERGAPVDVNEDEFDATPLDVVLWVWGRSTDEVKRERCYEAIALLAQNGAKLDVNQWSGPASEGPGLLEKIRADSRMQAALRGEMAR
jgi:ankyrin repeat protein